ncbi:MAG: aromatic ring-hydroxylating dioxygenase subunit alpha [Halioglobus sp.]|nr:aromatic ring-hydroxylating dioxygenase subunit alpha [Halioglobus sp.]
MPHQPAISLLKRLQSRAAGEGPEPAAMSLQVPASNYTEEERFAQERQRLFLRRPLVVGHESQLPEPGDTLVFDWLGLPLITMRDKAGNIGTFMNVCRHRGTRLVQEEGTTRLRSLVCPYHQWTYGLDGELRNVPRSETFDGLDTAQMGLVALPCEVRGGLIWIQAEGEMDLDGHLAGLDQDLEFFDIPGFQFYASNVRTVDCNWKLIQDAFLDGYHVTRLHKNTVGSFFPDSMAESDQIGDHIRSAVARKEIFDATGLAADALDTRRHATYSYTVFPNAVLVMHPDYTSIISLFPTSAQQTVFAHTMLTPHAPTTAEEQDHFQRSFELIDQGVFQAEDIFVSVAAQKGMQSGANESLLFGGLEEAAIRFHKIVERELA